MENERLLRAAQSRKRSSSAAAPPASHGSVAARFVLKPLRGSVRFVAGIGRAFAARPGVAFLLVVAAAILGFVIANYQDPTEPTADARGFDVEGFESIDLTEDDGSSDDETAAESQPADDATDEVPVETVSSRSEAENPPRPAKPAGEVEPAQVATGEQEQDKDGGHRRGAVWLTGEIEEFPQNSAPRTASGPTERVQR